MKISNIKKMLNTFDGLLIAFEYYHFAMSLSSLRTVAYGSLLKDYVHFSVLMNHLPLSEVLPPPPIFSHERKHPQFW
jgi:hypothetical protein